jgi:ribosomal protein S18 acetylase RimI-like enzyme
MGHPGDIVLRAETQQDLEFACRLYASARAYEMSRVPWSEEQKASFLRSQFQLQYAHYHKFYPGAAYQIVVHHEADIGRLYVDRTSTEIRLMEITLLPGYRNRGIGGMLVRALMEEAAASNRKISLHVEMDNPARRLYDRLGFRAMKDEGVYIRMEWADVTKTIAED